MTAAARGRGSLGDRRPPVSRVVRAVAIGCGALGTLILAGLAVTPVHRPVQVLAALLLVGVIVGLATALRYHVRRLAASEDRYRSLFEHSRDAVLLLTSDGAIIGANPSAERLFGRPEVDLIAQGCEAIVDPDHDAAAASWVARFHGGAFAGEAHLRRADGTRFPATITSGVFTGHDGARRISLFIRDISERREAEEELHKLSRAVEQSPALVLITNAAGRIEYVNPRFTAVTGYTADEARGQTPRLLKSGETPPDVYRNLWSTILGGAEWRGELHNRRKSGETYWAQASIFPLRDGAGRITHFLAMQEDITDRRRTEVDLRRTQTRLLQAQKMEAIGTLAGGVAHDVNNLLTIMMGTAELVQTALPAASPERPMLQEILEAGARGASLTRQLLASGRKLPAQPRVFGVGGVVKNLGGMLGRILGEDVVLSVLVSPDAGEVCADPTQIEQVLMNLVANGRDAMPRGGRLTIEVTNAVLDREDGANRPGAAPGRYVRVDVTDTGIGMDAQTQARIFEPFFTTKEIGKGTGLGLAVVYGIVQQNQGHIWVHSAPGRGARFELWLPRVEASLASGSTESHVLPAWVRGTETLLLAEDDGAVRAVLRESLTRLGYAVLEARRPDEALLVAENHPGPIDLLVTDVVMPQMDGRELAARLRRLRPDIGVVFMSGYPQAPPTGEDVGPDLLVKPVGLGDLARTVRRVLDERDARRPTDAAGVPSRRRRGHSGG